MKGNMICSYLALFTLLCILNGALAVYDAGNDQSNDNLGGESSASAGEVSMSGATDKVFTFFLAPQYFNWTEQGKVFEKDLVRYRATLLKQPSLPTWLKYRHSSRHKAGLLYGVPPSDGHSMIQVI